MSGTILVLKDRPPIWRNEREPHNASREATAEGKPLCRAHGRENIFPSTARRTNMEYHAARHPDQRHAHMNLAPWHRAGEARS